MKPRQRVVADQGVEGRARAVEGVLEYLDEILAQVGIEPVAGHVDQAGDEALERIAAREQAQARAFVQMHDAQAVLEKLVLADLEQLVARIGLQNVGQRLAGVAQRRESGPRHGDRHFLAQHGHVARRAVIGGRGEQADETMRADGLAVLRKALDADRIHVYGPMHRGAPVGLGDHQQGRLLEILELFGRHLVVLVHRAGFGAVLGIAQNAEGGARNRLPPRPAALFDQVVAAVAEESEVVLQQPVQERDRFVDFLFGRLGRGPLELIHDLVEGRGHGLPIVDHLAHADDDAAQAGFQLGQVPGIAVMADFKADNRFRPGLVRRLAGRV